jgi:hypothetical protein
MNENRLALALNHHRPRVAFPTSRLRALLAAFGCGALAAVAGCSSGGSGPSGSGAGSPSAGDGTGSGSGGSAGASTGSGGTPSGTSAPGAADSGGPIPVPSGPPCSPQGTCAGTLTCCGGQCVDTTKDPRNCGQCGSACDAGQFCTGVSCEDATLANVCANPKGTVVSGTFQNDNTAEQQLETAIKSACTGMTVVEASQSGSEGVVDPVSGAPITGVGDTFVSAGGSFGQMAVGYMDKAASTPVFVREDGSALSFVQRATGTVVASAPTSTLTASHDLFLVELAVEPAKGTLCFFNVGLYGPGTVAASVYVSSEILPNRQKYAQAWYVYEWTDANGNATPDMADTFKLTAQGD